MDSSLIFLVVIGLWAVYLVPQWMRRRERLSACRSADRSSTAIRVLSRRPRSDRGPAHPVSGSYVLAPARDAPAAADEVDPGSAEGAESEAAAPPASRSPRRAGHRRRRAARRGRRALGLCVVALLAVAALSLPVVTWLAVTGTLPWWTPAAVLGAVVVLVACLRVRARRRRARRRRAAAATVVRSTAVVVPGECQSVAPAPAESERVVTSDKPVPEVCEGEWTPVPVPLPSYLLKPEVPRRRVTGLQLDEVSRWHADWREPQAPERREPVVTTLGAGTYEVDEDDIPLYSPASRRAVGA